MKRFILAVLLVAVAASTAAAYNLNFTLYNETGYNITRMMASPSGNDEWDPDLDTITPGRLRNGYHSRITFNNVNRYRRNSSHWDLRLYYAGRWHEWHNIPLSRVSRVYVNRRNQIDYE